MKLNTNPTTVDKEEVLKIAKRVWEDLDFNHPVPYFNSKSYLGEEINRLAVKHSSEYLDEKNIHFEELIPLKNTVEKIVSKEVFSFLGFE